MFTRLGQVLYLSGCGIAGICAVLLVGMIFNRPSGGDWVGELVIAIVGVAAWLLGRALLYVLAAK